MTPATTGSSGQNDAGLAVGQSFSDPAGGLTITNMAMSNSGATIQVTYTAGSGDPTCMDGTPFTAPGPGIESCSGTTAGTGGTTGGTAGTTGTGGTTGRGGAGGTTGGRGGSGGRGGTAGTIGAGTAGTTGAGGTTPPAGSGGSISPVGAGGTTGTAGTSGQDPNDRGVSGGCSCDTAASAPQTLAATLLALAAIGLTVVMRRPRGRIRARRR
jgi:hypothetical protein